MAGLSDKVEKAQREMIGIEREKRQIEEEKNSVSRLEQDLRSTTRDTIKGELVALRKTSRD